MDLSTSVTALLGLLGLAILASFVRAMLSGLLDLMREDFYTLVTITGASMFICYLSSRWLSSILSTTEDDECWLMIPVLAVLVLVSLTVLITVAPALLMKTAWWVTVKACRGWFWSMGKAHSGVCEKGWRDIEKGE
jgi:uncharacterized membrane protein